MGEKLIALLTPVSHFFQKGVGSISSVLGDVAPFWIIVGVIVVALIIAIFTLDKPKSLSMLLIVYIIGFVLLLIPAVMRWLTNNMTSHDLYYAKIALGALPIVALVVLKYKKRR
ncbi:MAG: hypothetical protein AAB483_03055 [Patescibacteria group bacterium]